MRFAGPDDQFYRVAPAEVRVDKRKRDVPPPFAPTDGEAGMIGAFNACVATHAGVAIDDLPVMPIKAVFAGPFYFRCSMTPPHRGFTMGCGSVFELLKGAGEEMGISKDRIRKIYRNPQVAKCQS